jgi:hypothetical protein
MPVDIRHEVQKQYLQWQQRRQADDDGKTDHENLGEIAGQQIERKAADIVEDDTAFSDRMDDSLEGVIEQHHSFNGRS